MNTYKARIVLFDGTTPERSARALNIAEAVELGLRSVNLKLSKISLAIRSSDMLNWLLGYTDVYKSVHNYTKAREIVADYAAGRRL